MISTDTLIGVQQAAGDIPGGFIVLKPGIITASLNRMPASISDSFPPRIWCNAAVELT